MFSKPEEVARFSNSVCDNDGPAQGAASAKSKLLFLIGGAGYRVSRSRYWYCADHDEGTETAETTLNGKPCLEL